MQRDHQDSHREVGALKLLPDSILIDTSALTVDQAVTKIMKIIQGLRYNVFYQFLHVLARIIFMILGLKSKGLHNLPKRVHL